MTATRIPPPPFATPFLDGGFVANAWQFFITALYGALYGQGFDKVDAAHTAAIAAVPRTTQVIAGGGLQAGGALTDNVGVALYATRSAVAALPASGAAEGDWAYAIDGRKAGEGVGAGTGVPVWWSNGNWYAADSGAVVAA